MGDSPKGTFLKTYIGVYIFEVPNTEPEQIRMFLGLPDPDPFLRDMDPDLSPSIIKQN
jgi:hypothetical protein